MKTYITIDGGTTNTRVNLVIDRKIIATKKIARGARAGIDDKEGLKIALHDAIAELLAENNLTEGDLCKILASGMITSEFGLVELPHLTAPAGIRDLHDNMAEISFPEISTVPIVFVRGVKVNSENLCDFVAQNLKYKLSPLRKYSTIVVKGVCSPLLFSLKNAFII